MNSRGRDGAMIAGMIVAWSIFYAVSKRMVDATGSAYAAGCLLRMSALVFLTGQLVADGHFLALFRQGKAAVILVVIGVFGFLLDLFANLGYAGGSLSTSSDWRQSLGARRCPTSGPQRELTWGPWGPSLGSGSRSSGREAWPPVSISPRGGGFLSWGH